MMQDEIPLASFSILKPVKPVEVGGSMRGHAASSHSLAISDSHPSPGARRRGDQALIDVEEQDEKEGVAAGHAALGDEEVFHIRLADSARHQEAASVLIRKMYSWRGYAVETDSPGPVSRLTLFAECRGTVVGTMGLCLDGALGLPADENFREQIDLLRQQGRQLCEPSRLAIDAGMTKRVFASMIHVSYLYAHVLNGYSDYIIEVNPRHVTFYQRMLGFERVGPVRPCSRVGAPAVLLRLPLSHMGEQIRACGGRPELQSDERSFYPFFFAPHEEADIASRLLASAR